jgi:hypothetical protein
MVLGGIQRVIQLLLVVTLALFLPVECHLPERRR